MPGKGEREGEKRASLTLSAFPLANCPTPECSPEKDYEKDSGKGIKNFVETLFLQDYNVRKRSVIL